MDLLELLAQAGRADDSSDVLLAATRMHKWPMLALLAACNGCSPLRCMAEWLHATLAHSSPPAEGTLWLPGLPQTCSILLELSLVSTKVQASMQDLKQACVRCAGNEKSSEGDEAQQVKADGAESWRLAAGSALLAACRQGAFKQAIEAVQLFMPGCPLIGCLRFLQVQSFKETHVLVNCKAQKSDCSARQRSLQGIGTD